MSIKERFGNYWKNKTLFGKISDLVFVVFIIALIFPSGRMAIGGAINRVKAMISQPDIAENGEQMSENDYDWNLINANEEKVNLKDYKGKVLFINLWATWCPPCVGEMPEIQKLYNHFKDDSQIAFLLITSDPVSKIHSFIKKRSYDFPVYHSTSYTPVPFRVKSIPTTFIVSKTGKIIVKKTGAANWSGKKTIEILNNLKYSAPN